MSDLYNLESFATGQGFVYGKGLLETPDPFWRRVGEIAEQNLLTMATKVKGGFPKNRSSTGSYLINLGFSEQEKEKRLLYEKFGLGEYASGKRISLEEYPSFINVINKNMGIGDEFKTYLGLLNDYVQKNYKSPVAGTLLADKIFSIFQRKVVNIISSKNMQTEILNKDDPTATLEQRLREALEEAINEAIDQISNKETTKKGEDGSEMAVKILQGLERFKNTTSESAQLRELIFGRFRLDELASTLMTFRSDKSNNKKTFTRGKMKAALNLNNKGMRSFQGFLQEFCTELKIDAELNGNSASQVIVSNIMRADSVTLYATEAKADLSQILEEINKGVAPTSLEKARDIISNFTAEVLNKTTNGFLVYKSTKSYDLRYKFNERGFGNRTGASEMLRLLKNLGFIGDGSNLLEVVYNTGQGAILEDDTQIPTEIEELLVRGIAKMLFDDWQTIGEQSGAGQVIHLFNLNGVDVPLSYLLLAMGHAINEANVNLDSIMNISLVVPPLEDVIKESGKNIAKKEQKAKAKAKKEGNKEEVKTSILDVWRENSRVARNNTYIELSFLRNFNSLIQQMLQQFEN